LPAVAKHLRSIFAEGELEADAVVNKKLITATDRKKLQNELFHARRPALEAEEESVLEELEVRATQVGGGAKAGGHPS
jgi:hypothetical protein